MTYPFVGPLTVPTPTSGTHPGTKDYIDTAVATRAALVHAGQHASGGSDPVSPASIGAALTAHTHPASDVVSGTLAIARIPTGTTSSTVSLGDHTHSAAAPAAHASTHASAGSDPVSPASIGAALTSHSHAAADVTSGTFAIARIPTGTTSSTVAIGNDARLGVKPYPPVAITIASNLAATDASLGTHFRIPAAANFTISNPTNLVDGQVITWEVVASAGLTVALGTVFAFGSDITALSATVSGKTDYIQAVYNSTAAKMRVIGYEKGY